MSYFAIRAIFINYCWLFELLRIYKFTVKVLIASSRWLLGGDTLNYVYFRSCKLSLARKYFYAFAADFLLLLGVVSI